jgi:hypothetical protein
MSDELVSLLLLVLGIGIGFNVQILAAARLKAWRAQQNTRSRD